MIQYILIIWLVTEHIADCEAPFLTSLEKIFSSAQLKILLERLWEVIAMA